MQTIVSKWLEDPPLARFEGEFLDEDKLNQLVKEYEEVEVEQDAEEDGDKEEAVEDNNEKEQEEETPKIVCISFSSLIDVPPLLVFFIETPRAALRAWEKCEVEAAYLRHPRFVPLDTVVAFLHTFTMLRTPVLTGLDIEAVRKFVLRSGMGRRYARMYCACSLSNAVLMLRYVEKVRDDVALLRKQHADNPAAVLFAQRAEALVSTVDAQREELEKRKKAESDRRTKLVRSVVNDAQSTTRKLEHATEENWTSTKADIDKEVALFKAEHGKTVQENE